MLILNWQVNSFSNFVSFFIVITYNYPVNLKLIHFLLCIKGSNESLKFENFVCSGEHLPNFSCHVPNHKSVFLQILHHTLVSWNIAPLYFLNQTLYTLVKSSPLKCKFSRLFFKFCMTFQCRERWLLCTFLGQTLCTLHERDQSKCKFLRLLSAPIKIHQILVIFETRNCFFFKFCITLQCHET